MELVPPAETKCCARPPSQVFETDQLGAGTRLEDGGDDLGGAVPPSTTHLALPERRNVGRSARAAPISARRGALANSAAT
jgi:hypothetical protein